MRHVITELTRHRLSDWRTSYDHPAESKSHLNSSSFSQASMVLAYIGLIKSMTLCMVKNLPLPRCELVGHRRECLRDLGNNRGVRLMRTNHQLQRRKKRKRQVDQTPLKVNAKKTGSRIPRVWGLHLQTAHGVERNKLASAWNMTMRGKVLLGPRETLILGKDLELFSTRVDQRK